MLKTGFLTFMQYLIWIVILKAVCRFIVFSSANFPVFPFLPPIFPLPLTTLLIDVLSSSTPHWAIEMKKQNKTYTHKKKNRVCNRFLVPASGNLGSSSLTPEGPVLPLVCGFRRRDNLLAWRELFVNLYELKYLVWSWEEYNHFKWIYRVYRFLRFSKAC